MRINPSVAARAEACRPLKKVRAFFSSLLALALIAGSVGWVVAQPPPPPPPQAPGPPPMAAPPQSPGSVPAQAPGQSAESPGDERTPPRLSFVDGQVSFWRPGAPEWTAAQINTALAPGDELATGSPGNFEIQIGARAFVRG